MKFWEALTRRSRQADAAAAQAVDVSDEEANRQAIEDSQKLIARYEASIVTLKGSRKIKERKLPTLRTEIAKYEGWAKKAGLAQDTNSLRQAVTKLTTLKSELKILETEIAKDSAEETKYCKQLDNGRDIIARAQQKTQMIKVKEDSAAIRRSMVQGQLGEGTSPLARLGEWERKVDQADAEAEAAEELADARTGGETALEEKYGDGDTAVDDLMAQYLSPGASVTKVIAGELTEGGPVGPSVTVTVTQAPSRTAE